MASATLGDAAIALLREPVVVHLATTDADGTPHVTPVWVAVEDSEVVVNTADNRHKAHNLRRSPRVALSAADPTDPYRVVAFQGTVLEVTDEDADAHIDRLAKKYLGVDAYPMRQPGERRVKVRIRPDRVLMQPAAGGS